MSDDGSGLSREELLQLVAEQRRALREKDEVSRFERDVKEVQKTLMV